MAALGLMLALCACDNAETTMAKCRMEAMKALGAASTDRSALGGFIQSCMIAAGYGVSAGCTDVSISGQWLVCYEPKGLIAKLSNAGQSK